MLSSVYVEDLFLDFCSLFHAGKIPVQPQDILVVINFETVIKDKKPLTQNQGNYIIKILKKYQNFSSINNVDYTQSLNDPQWKQDFRILDLSKKIYVTEDTNRTPWVCLKFPYQLKKEFETEFSLDHKRFIWDNDLKIRKGKIYESNLIRLFEFAQKHSFEVDNSFMSAMAQVEEIWQSSEELLPFSIIEQDKVILKNAKEDALEYFQEKSTTSILDNILLAKNMGFPFQGSLENVVVKIASVEGNHFWIKDYDKYFNLITSIKGRVVIILDRVAGAQDWLKNFSYYAEKFSIDPDEIKICFREEKKESTGLNNWIKEKGYGGKVEEGRILIFLQKPSKWLFKDIESVKIVTTTSLYPPPNPMTRDFFNSQSCVIFLGDIKPSEKRDQRIVEL